jgi:glyoxylase-like metal-dependent hydrolase (beta-lactamase superfamily II)/rhodanese-related sulfurtransferase
MITFRQLFDPTSSTYTYLLASDGQALLIDPVFEQASRDQALLRELDLTLLATLETHVHADHVTGAWLHRHRSGSKVLLSGAAGATGADRLLAPGDAVAFGSRHLQARATPGHTAGCMSYVLDDASMVFTGDTLLIRGCGRTDFQGGSAALLFRSVQEQLFTLPGDCLIFPGHDYRGLAASSVAEERRFNPRLGGAANETDFIGYMSHLGLPHPKQMDVAVPANLRCGEPAQTDGAGAALQPTWAALTFTFGGIWEMTPETLAESVASVQVLDVREAQEFNDALGHIPCARLLPMTELGGRLNELDKQRPVVAVCRSGTRSAQACVLLARAGFLQVANLAGGMLRWRAQGHAVEGGMD